MSKTAFIFPGQGAQYVGMGKTFYDEYEVSRRTFEEASDAIHLDMAKLCFEENDDINITEYTQAAMVTTSVAMLRVLEEKGIAADMTAGLSLGEYCALVAAKAMSFADAVKVVRQRGILMQEAVPVGQGAMSAVLAMDAAVIEEVCESVEGIVSIANYNCPGQIVITGETDAVAKAGELLKERGAKRVVPLKVSGPFHSAMLTSAGQKLGEVLKDVEVMNPVIPYATNVTAELITSAAPIKDLLTRQVASSVRWQQDIEVMMANGVTRFVEIGPGKTLAGFNKKINREIETINIETTQDLEKVLS